MQWIVALKAENNPIVLGRLMNALRRKGAVINTLTLGTRIQEFSLMALIESPENSIDHIFNFLRLIVGVRDVTYYRHESSGKASFIFIETAQHAQVTKVLEDFPRAKLVFASQGRYLVEIGEKHDMLGQNRLAAGDGFLSFARVRTS